MWSYEHAYEQQATGGQQPGAYMALDAQIPAIVGLVSRRLDEVAQISGNYYLGRAYLRWGGGGYYLAAFFSLQREVI